MERLVESKLTIYFEEPFWVGVFEELEGDKLSACRMVFGAEPGTKSQQALQKQYEENKTERKRTTREQREAEKQRQFELKQQKRKEKHRGH